MTLDSSTSARRAPTTYLLLLLGLVFAYGGATIDPASNCDESGRECAPWLVPVAFWVGVVTTLMAAALWLHNPRWGLRVDTVERRLYWWDGRIGAGLRSVSLDELASIRLASLDDERDVLHFEDGQGQRLPAPSTDLLPANRERWLQALQQRFPHLRVAVERR